MVFIKGALKNALHILHCLPDHSVLPSTLVRLRAFQHPEVIQLSTFLLRLERVWFISIPQWRRRNLPELFLCVAWNSVARGSEAVSVTYGPRRDVKQSIAFLSTASQ
jgi:hypothetical protein